MIVSEHPRKRMRSSAVLFACIAALAGFFCSAREAAAQIEDPGWTSRVLLININSANYNAASHRIFDTMQWTPAPAWYVNLINPGDVVAALAAREYDQVWVFDLSHGADQFPEDYQAIADWYNARQGAIIADGRMISSYWNGRYPNEGARLTVNYYKNLAREGGGLVLGTDHYIYHRGINEINRLIGINPFVGEFDTERIPVDSANSLMNWPNNMGTSLHDDSSPGQVPFGVQPNGKIFFAVAWHNGGLDTPGISSTIRSIYPLCENGPPEPPLPPGECPASAKQYIAPMIGPVADLKHKSPLVGPADDLNRDGQDDFLVVGRCRTDAGLIGNYVAALDGRDTSIIRRRLEFPSARNDTTVVATDLFVTHVAGLRADFTGDGVNEFAVGSRGNCSSSVGSLIVYDGASRNKLFEYAPGIGCAGYSAAAGDLDLDGTPDLVIGDPAQKKLFAYIGRGAIGSRPVTVIDPTTSDKYKDHFKDTKFCFTPCIPIITPVGVIDTSFTGRGVPLVNFGVSVSVLEDERNVPRGQRHPPVIVAADSQRAWLPGNDTGAGTLFAFKSPAFGTPEEGTATLVDSSDPSVATAEALAAFSKNYTYTLTVNSLATPGILTFNDRWDRPDAFLNPAMPGPDVVFVTVGTTLLGQERIQVPVSKDTTAESFVAEFNDTAKNAIADLFDFGTPGSPAWGIVITTKKEGLGAGTISTSVPGSVGALLAHSIVQAADAQLGLDGSPGPITRGSNVIEDLIPGLKITLLTPGVTTLTITMDAAAPGTPTAELFKVIPDFGKGYLGYTLYNAGDLDNDGFGDLLVGAPGEVNPITFTSGTTVLSGKKLTPLRFKRAVGDSGNASTFGGDGTTVQFGFDMTGRSDLDSDGKMDVVVGAPGDEDAVGMVRIFSGHDKHLLFELNGTGEVLTERFGHSVAALNHERLVVVDRIGYLRLYVLGPDTNRDGHPDRCQVGNLEIGTYDTVSELNTLSRKMIMVLKALRPLIDNQSLPTNVVSIVGLRQDRNGRPTGPDSQRRAAEFRNQQIKKVREYINESSARLMQLLTDNQPALQQYHRFLAPNKVPKIRARLGAFRTATGENLVTEGNKFTKVLNQIQIGSSMKPRP